MMSVSLFRAGLVFGLVNLVCATGAQTAPTPVKIQPLAGQVKSYKVRRGDTLLKVARRNNVTVGALRAINHLKKRRVKAGTTLLLPTQYILPRNPKDGIVLNIAEREVYLFTDGQLKAHYPVAVGKPGWQTAQGTFRLVQKKTNPTWHPTKNIVEKDHIKDEPVPPGAENPLGDRWMGWSKPGYGFHSTISPRSIGSPASHGCVRLYPESARAMFDRVKVGMTIYALYSPVLVGRQGDKVFLTIFPDFYKTGQTSLAHVQKVLTQAGLKADALDAKAVLQTVKAHDGIPHRISPTLAAQAPDAPKATAAKVRAAPPKKPAPAGKGTE